MPKTESPIAKILQDNRKDTQPDPLKQLTIPTIMLPNRLPLALFVRFVDEGPTSYPSDTPTSMTLCRHVTFKGNPQHAGLLLTTGKIELGVSDYSITYKDGGYSEGTERQNAVIPDKKALFTYYYNQIIGMLTSAQERAQIHNKRLTIVIPINAPDNSTGLFKYLVEMYIFAIKRALYMVLPIV